MYTIRTVSLERDEHKKILDDWSNHRIATNLTLACWPPISKLSLDDLFELIVAAGEDVNVGIPIVTNLLKYTFFDKLVDLGDYKKINFMLKYSCAWGEDPLYTSISNSCKKPGLLSILRVVLTYSPEVVRNRHMRTWKVSVLLYNSKRQLCIDTLGVLVSSGFFLENGCSDFYDELDKVRAYIFGYLIYYSTVVPPTAVEHSFLLDAIITGYF